MAADPIASSVAPNTSGIIPRLLQSEGLITLLVTIGSTAAFVSLVIDYLTGDPAGEFGRGQILLLAVGVLTILCAITLEIATNRRGVAEVLRFWTVVAQVALVAAVVRLYNLENAAFYLFILPLILCGFVINHYLKASYRPAFFLSLSIGSIVGIIGLVSIAAALWLIGLALVLTTVCHLPIALWMRAAILVACCGLLAFVRLGWLEVGDLALVLPILASMFMFRIVIYLYDTANGKGPTDLASRLSYFFMVPNVVFPFFPVVDFATFGRTYYSEDPTAIYQRGANWILRGAVHLLLFRVVNYYFVIGVEDVVDPASFLRFIVANFCLYLRISGLFHIIVGFLLLFGFNLPETHSRYFLSSSFIDFWRRINIYWKDFMQKLVFNPTYMALKNRGAKHLTSIIIAMFIVFFCTWALHAYQWFWLRGAVLLSAQDMLFWGILAVFLAIQTLGETRMVPVRQNTEKYSHKPRLVLALRLIRIACTFLTICILWSLWTSESTSAWFDLWRASGLVPAFDNTRSSTGADWIVTVATLAVVALMAAVAAGFAYRIAPAVGSRQTMFRRAATQRPVREFYGSALAAASVCAVLLASQVPAVTTAFGSAVKQVADDIRETRLNARDKALLERGYYQQLTNIGGVNSPLWEVLMNQRMPTGESQHYAKRDDYLSHENMPMATYMHRGVLNRINRWGMRDQDYEEAKAPGTYRIAILGASREVGWGVPVDDRFDTIMESRLNSEHPGGASRRYEILNFATEGYLASQRLLTLDWKIGPFQPDAIFYVAGHRDPLIDHEAEMVVRGIRSPYPALNEIIDMSGAHSGMSISQIKRLLRPHWVQILDSVYTEIARISKLRGAEPVWIYLPDTWGKRKGTVEERPWVVEVNQQTAQMKELAQRAGFTVIDLSEIYDGEDGTTLELSPNDMHPNSKANAIIADALYGRLHALKTWPQ